MEELHAKIGVIEMKLGKLGEIEMKLEKLIDHLEKLIDHLMEENKNEK